MKNSQRMIAVLGLFLAFAMILPAAEVQGILIDRICSAKALKDGQQFAQMHTRECALKCKASGFGVYTTDGHYLKFDNAGNKEATTLLEQSDKKNNLQVEVTGEVEGDTIKVTSLKFS